jgi:hypothetical protein
MAKGNVISPYGLPVKPSHHAVYTNSEIRRPSTSANAGRNVKGFEMASEHEHDSLSLVASPYGEESPQSQVMYEEMGPLPNQRQHRRVKSSIN